MSDRKRKSVSPMTKAPASKKTLPKKTSAKKPAVKKNMPAKQKAVKTQPLLSGGAAASFNNLIMSARAWRQMLFWLGFLFVSIVLMYVFRSILLPYFAGMALAYLLDPVADWLESKGASRVVATSAILLVFILIFTYIVMRLLPVLVVQLTNFIERIPSLIGKLQELIANSDNDWLKKVVGGGANTIRENSNQVIHQGVSWATTVLASIWNSGKAIVDVMALFVITPIVAFYLLLDWDPMVAKIRTWLPQDHKSGIEEIVSDINKAIAGFIRGQGSVCLILGSFYAATLTLAGLNFGLLIGMISGLISFIPFVGSLIGFLLAISVAIVQFWPDYVWILVIAGIFMIGQFIEGNILQPKLVGGSVGLHPVWLMFSLSAFGVLMGFTGLLIAVPVAASIGVLVRYALKKYLQSDYYLGTGDKNEETA